MDRKALIEIREMMRRGTGPAPISERAMGYVLDAIIANPDTPGEYEGAIPTITHPCDIGPQCEHQWETIPGIDQGRRCVVCGQTETWTSGQATCGGDPDDGSVLQVPPEAELRIRAETRRKVREAGYVTLDELDAELAPSPPTPDEVVEALDAPGSVTIKSEGDAGNLFSMCVSNVVEVKHYDTLVAAVRQLSKGLIYWRNRKFAADPIEVLAAREVYKTARKVQEMNG